MAEKNQDDKELNKLLDDCLEDFNKYSTQAGCEDPNKTEGTVDADEFFMDQAKLLAERMNTLFGGAETPSGDVPPLPQDPDQILEGFKKMAEAAQLTLQGVPATNEEEVAKYSDSISQALKGLKEGSEGLTAPIMDNDFLSMFNGLNMDGSEGDNAGNTFLPFMEGMMQSLLSAEILLPSIKELLSKYPTYMEENGDKISAEDKTRYEKQIDLYKIIEGHLENEQENDTAAVKREKCKIVLEDMRKLQEYGQPPEELLADATGQLPLLNPAGTDASNPQCPMM